MENEHDADSKDKEQTGEEASVGHVLRILQVLQPANWNPTRFGGHEVNKRALWIVRVPPRGGFARGK